MFRPRVCLAGDDLLSHLPTEAVSSALVSLTAGFGMGPGGASPRLSPANQTLCRYLYLRQRKQIRRAKVRLAQIVRSHSGVSTARLNSLLSVHLQPIKLVVYQRPYSKKKSDLISRSVSHLDAFSGYPFAT